MKFLNIFKRKKQKKKEQGKLKEAFKVYKQIDGNYKEFEKKLLHHSLIMLIIGKRGSGKTALGMKMLEFFSENSKKKLYAMGFDKAKLPHKIRKISKIEDIKNNSILMADEGGVIFSAREPMKEVNKFLSKIMAIARHKNLTLILITQNCMPLRTEVITEKGIKKLKEIGIGNKLLSYNLKKKCFEFKKSFISPVKEQKIIKIETKEGDIIECSPEHKLLIKKGKKIVKKKAKDLTEKDFLFKPLKFK